PPLRTVADVVARRGRAQRLPPSGVRRARPQVERAARARRELDRLQHDDRDPPRRLPLVLRVGRPELDHLRPEAVALLALGDARLDAELLAADLHLRLVALQVVEPRRVALRAPDRGDEDDPVAVAPVQERRRPHLPGLPALRRQQQHWRLLHRPADPRAARPVQRRVERADEAQQQPHPCASARSACWSAAEAGPSAIGRPSTSATGSTSRTEDDVNASSAASSSPSRYAPSSTSYPSAGACSASTARVTPARMPSAGAGV